MKLSYLEDRSTGGTLHNNRILLARPVLSGDAMTQFLSRFFSPYYSLFSLFIFYRKNCVIASSSFGIVYLIHLEVLIANPDGIAAKDAISSVRDSFELTDYERGNYDSGSERFEKILRFATVD